MPKPILTDEIIEKAKRDKARIEEKLQREMENDQELAEKYDRMEKDLSKQSVYKSRRIENVKRQERGKILNKWLTIVTVIVVILGILFFWYYF